MLFGHPCPDVFRLYLAAWSNVSGTVSAILYDTGGNFPVIILPTLPERLQITGMFLTGSLKRNSSTFVKSVDDSHNRIVRNRFIVRSVKNTDCIPQDSAES